jgi:peptidoglycan/xylan/chitin deacetylase (PgdA/CDA1 family)
MTHRSAAMDKNPLVLMFHRVLPRSEISIPNAYWDRGTLISLEKFRSILDAMERHGLHAVTMRSWQAMTGAAQMKACILTFDDGYQDNYAFAIPELEARGHQGVFFPVLGCCESNTWLVLDAYYAALDTYGTPHGDRIGWIRGKEKSDFMGASEEEKWRIVDTVSGGRSSLGGSGLYMDDHALRHVHALGHELGGHTHWHTLLRDLPASAIMEIFKINYFKLKKLTGCNPISFAWPNGDYDRVALDAFASSGFQYAFGVGASSDRFGALDRIPRVFCRETTEVDALFVNHRW